MPDPFRIKTLDIIPSVSPAFGGPSEVVLNLTRELRRLGIDAEIATTNDNMMGTLEVPLGERVDYQNVPVWFFPRFPLRVKEFLFSAQLSQWVWRNLRNYQFATAHYLFSFAPTCLATVARLQQIPYAVCPIGQLTPWSLSQGKVKKQLYSALVERRNLESAAYLHCTSLQEAEEIEQLGIKTPKLVLPLGVNPPTLCADAKLQICAQYGIPNHQPIILFLSRLHPKKRPELLIRLLGQIASQGETFHLIIAGDGPPQYVETLQQLTRELNLTHHITFTGFVQGLEKDRLFQGSDLFVLPTYSENFGIVLAEAMIAGLPILTTPGAQISREIAQAKAGLIADSEVDLQLALQQLLSSPSLRRELGQNGKQLAQQRYSWPAIAQEFANTYRAVLERKSLPAIHAPFH
ncbi:glycosyltransferase [Lyngbya confervoides]|uniref:Glycosyltransferase n=1 Tax=Lyngbya confervoides BDU141951 TaxID=1574623 RepID=A0ABD4T7K8_9CYAN|nr:glycosyltransferase [Lyngbya confervoides]MCM1984601.1 glycosyltransferase [Lyngbya confervoides BDU141951]